jgi:hypothetical protein
MIHYHFNNDKSIKIKVLDIDIDTDASKCGLGAVLYLPDPNAAPDPILLNAARRALPPSMTLTSIKSALRQGIKICGFFSPGEAEESSNVRKLLATAYSFHKFPGLPAISPGDKPGPLYGQLGRCSSIGGHGSFRP